MNTKFDNNPWLGLSSYEYEDAYRFFGRNNDIEELCTSIKNNPFTTLYGISGAGKTSLINAGLIPNLEKEDYIPVRVRLDHQSSTGYCSQIINAILNAVEQIQGDIEIISELDHNKVPEYDRLWLFLFTNRIWSKSNRKLTPVIFIDQFEEIFTKNEKNEDNIKSFFNTIDSLQYNTPPISITRYIESFDNYIELNNLADFRMVFSLREDFLARLEDYSYDIAALRKNRKGIKRMNGIQALEVILNPKPNFISRDVALRILSKVNGKDVANNKKSLSRLSVDTSILSLFCSELYSRITKTGQNEISLKNVDDYGDEIIPSFYNEAMNMISPGSVEYLESHLLTHSGFRNSVAIEDLEQGGISKDELTKLTQIRLIRIETAMDYERVEFTHDVLCAIAKENRDKRLAAVKRKQKLVSSILVYASYVMTAIFSTLMILAILFKDYYPPYSGGLHLSIPSFLVSSIALFCICKSYTKFLSLHETKYFSYTILYVFVFYSSFLIYNRISYYSAENLHLTLTLCLPLFLLVLALLSVPIFTYTKTKINRIGKISIVSSFVILITSYFICHTALSFFVFIIFLTAVVLPYNCEKDKNSWWMMLISILILVIPCILPYLHYTYLYYRHRGVYDLTAIFYGCYCLIFMIISLIRYRKKRSCSEALNYCFSLQVYSEYPYLKHLSLSCLLFILICVSRLIGLSLNGLYSITIIPIIGALCSISITALYKTKEGITNHKLLAKELLQVGLLTFILIIIFIALQYVRWHTIWMICMWLISLFIVFRLHKRIEIKSKSALVFTFIFSIIIIPLLGIGYNVFSLPRTSRVFTNPLFLTESPQMRLITIRDNTGLIGLRDRNNLVIPVKYKSIEVGVVSLNKENYYSSWSEEDQTFIPHISFKLIDPNGNRSVWECSDHLEMSNKCTEILLSQYKDLLSYNPNRYINSIVFHNYIKTFYSNKDSRLKKTYEISEIIENCLNSVNVSSSVNITNINRKWTYTVDETDISKVYDCVRNCSNAFQYLDDYVVERRLLDTLLVEICKKDSLSNFIIDYSETSLWRMEAKDYEKAFQDSRKSLNQSNSLTNPAYITLVESSFFLQEFDTTHYYLDKLLNYNSDCYCFGWFTGSDAFFESDIRSDSTINNEFLLWRDTITGPDPFNYRIFPCDVIGRDFVDYKRDGLIKAEFINEYHEILSKLSSIFYKDSCDAALRYGYGQNTYYLCKSYNKEFYQFYSYQNKRISPMFNRFSYSYDEDILLVIDVFDHKRKFIDLSEDVPKTIPGAFDHAWPFSEGLAVVMINNKVGVINTNGEWVIAPRFEVQLEYPKVFMSYYNYSDKIGISNWLYNIASSDNIIFRFENGVCPMYDETGSLRAINTQGEWVD